MFSTESLLVNFFTVKGWQNVTFHVIKDRKVVFTGQPYPEKTCKQAVVPILSSTKLTFHQLASILEECRCVQEKSDVR